MAPHNHGLREFHLRTVNSGNFDNAPEAVPMRPYRNSAFHESRTQTPVPVGPENPFLGAQPNGNAQQQPVHQHPVRGHRWRSPLLKWYTFAAMIAAELGIMIVLGALMVLSKRNSGFAAIGGDFDFSLDFESTHFQQTFGKAFLWTSLPTFFMGLFSLSFTAIFGAYSEELPYRNLQEGGSIDRTVCLDYHRYASFYKYWPALRKGDVTFGLGAFFAFVTSVLLVPLAAHIFQPVYPTFAVNMDFPALSAYNASSLPAVVDYAPIIGVVAAVRVYGGKWPHWTDGSYAVAEHGLPKQLASGLNVTGTRINAMGHSATLDCRALSEYSLTRNPASGDTATLALDAVDMGCNVSLTAGVGPGNEIYLKSVSNTNCPEGSGSSRIGFLAGRYSSSSTYLLEDINVIACTPSYSQTSGTIVSPPGFDPMTFEPTPSVSEARPDSWALFEKQLVSLSNIGNNNSPDFSSQFGQLILEVIRTQDATLLLDPGTLLSTIPSVFQSVYAILARTRMFASLPDDQTTTDAGNVIYSESRLATVSWSVDITIAIIAILTVLTICLAIIVPRKRPMLAEEPRGLLSGAALLANSNLQEAIRDEEWRLQYGGRLHKWLKDKYVLGQERCTVDPHGRIDVSGWTPKQRKHPSVSSGSAA